MNHKTSKSIRIPLSNAARKNFEARAKVLNMSNSSFARMLISRELAEERDIQINLNMNPAISYESYIQTYLPETLDNRIGQIVEGTDYDKSKLAWYLVMKGMEAI